MSEALKINNLEVSISGMHIVRGISLDVAHGETVGVIGPNGSGKTTLFNAISGFVQIQDGGELTLLGKKITHAQPHQRALFGLGRVFQNSGVFREMTVLENMILGLESHTSIFKTFFPWSKVQREFKQKSLELLAEVKLDTKANHKASSLSGGQLRLLEIIRAVAFGAEVLLLDEPTAGVSPKMKEDVADLIVKLKQRGKTILIIEHDINFIERFCNRIVVLEAGQIGLIGTPLEVRSDARLQEIYFGKR